MDRTLPFVLPLAAALAAAVGGGCNKASAPPVQALYVAAAADLSDAFGEIGRRYEKATGQSVVISFGASGLLEKQVAEGAPFDVFASANVTFADDAVASGSCLADSKALYATGQIVLFPAPDAAFAAHTLADLADPRIRKIAIANPAHAPYGRAAEQALETSGVAAAVHGKLVYGENVHEALQFAKSGNADAALVARSLVATAPDTWSAIPPVLYDRIDQALVVCTRGRAGAAAGRRFAAFVATPESRGILTQFGFAIPPGPALRQ
jgi:molybdate transport system substrate-binding protein